MNNTQKETTIGNILYYIYIYVIVSKFTLLSMKLIINYYKLK